MDTLTPFLVIGVAFGAVYAVSGVGLLVLYRTTGVINFAFGAIGAFGALIAWELINEREWGEWWAYAVCVIFAAVVTLAYGMLIAPRLADRDALVKAVGTLGFMLILFGIMFWRYDDDARTLVLPTTNWRFTIADTRVNGTQVLAIAIAIVVSVGTGVFLKVTKVGTAMRAIANDRSVTSMLGVPVRRIEVYAWLGNGVLCGVVGLLLSNLLRLDMVALTFLVISALAAALIGGLRSPTITFVAGMVIGVVESVLTNYDVVTDFRTMTPFVLAIVALLWAGRRRTIDIAGRAAG